MSIYAVNSSAMDAAVKPLGELIVGLGARLRFLRNQKGWTLEQLSTRTSLSEPFLSRLESGQRQPSLAALMTLAHAHSMPLASLLEEVPATAPPVVIKAGSSSERYANGLQYRVVSGAVPKGNLHAVHVTIPPEREHQDFYHHDGEEWLYVLSGQLRLIFKNGEHLLKPGDSAHFEAHTPHRLVANGQRNAAAVIVSCAAPLPSIATVRLGTSKIRSGEGCGRARLRSVADEDKFMSSKVRL